MSPFKEGQRWISETEPELGLGTVLEVGDRIVKVLFTATGEARQYARASAPLERAAFKPGEMIATAEGASLRVDTVNEVEGLLVYACGKLEIPESLLDDQPPAARPEDRLLHGKADPPGLYALRLETWQHRARMATARGRGFAGARIDLIPHQLYIAERAVQRSAPRILLADEVGLGKTIEAGLILHRLLVSARINRVLILLPEALIHQWFVELLRRFNLNPAIYNEDRCEAAEAGAPEGNPFLAEQVILASTDFFDRHPGRMGQALQAGWDLMIIDEAHHLEWAPDAPSSMYQFAYALAQESTGVLLLTATPEELGLESHYARLHLLDPGRYPDYATFIADHEKHEATAREAEAQIAKGEDIHELLDRYGPGRVIFRNSRRTMKGFPERRACLAPLAPGDSREAWLAELLRSLDGEKVFLITTTRVQALELQEALTRHIQVKTALFHEDMELIARDRSAAWFSEEDGAQLLISSEIGGEGRNFQFAHHMVLWDLPGHPETIEQRIGRLDRIGQNETIHVHVPYATGGEEEHRVRWLDEGLDAFSHCLLGGANIHAAFKERMEEPIQELIADTRRHRVALEKQLAVGTNRLLELHSFNAAVAEDIVASVRTMDEDPALEPFLLRLFDHFGIHAEELDRKTYRLVPSHTFRDGIPGFNKEGMTVTLDRSCALAREDWVFLTWDHPLVAGAMDVLTGSEQGTGTASTWANTGATGLLLEAVFIVEAIAPPLLEADRYLPATPLRVCVDLSMNPAEDAPIDLPDGRNSGVLDGGEPLRDRVRDMLEACTGQAEQKAVQVRCDARKRMHDLLDPEVARLEHLLAVNDHVHPEELEALHARVEQLEEQLGTASTRLDAVRLILSGA
jgi:ATP-dependent helicase HepA